MAQMAATTECAMTELRCGYQWTTGSGPDDPDDTGVHLCERPADHDPSEHLCRCGGSKSS
jgi:hypothetical protein